jgi:transposase
MEERMELFVGLDVSQETTHVCVVDSNGSVFWQGQCPSTPDAVAELVNKRAPAASRIGFESGMLSTWFWHVLTSLNLPVVCLDARHAKAALSMQVNKTDKNDAFGLAQIVRIWWYKEVGVKSMDSHTVRAVLGARAQLVGMRRDVTNQIRGVLKTFGVVLGKKSGSAFDKEIEDLARGDGMFNKALQALLSVLKILREQTELLDDQVRDYAQGNPVCRHLMGVPGIGPVTAAAFVTSVDDATKFSKSKSVGAFFGLTPRRYQSGEIDRTGRISKCGDSLVRSYLYEAAGTLLTRVKRPSALKAWGLRLAKRRGLSKAKAAVARKMAVIMHRMWVTGEPFRWSAVEEIAE